MLYTVPLMALALLATAVFFRSKSFVPVLHTRTHIPLPPSILPSLLSPLFSRLHPHSSFCSFPAHPLTPVLTADTGGILVPDSDYPASHTLPVVLSMLIFVAAYATGSGNIPWQQGELFPLDVRGLGTSLCTATNWSCNLLVAATFLSLMEAATPSGAFGLYALVCVAGWVFVWRCYPETSGLSLEEVSEVFADDFGVVKSQEMRRAKGVAGV